MGNLVGDNIVLTRVLVVDLATQDCGIMWKCFPFLGGDRNLRIVLGAA